MTRTAPQKRLIHAIWVILIFLLTDAWWQLRIQNQIGVITKNLQRSGKCFFWDISLKSTEHHSCIKNGLRISPEDTAIADRIILRIGICVFTLRISGSVLNILKPMYTISRPQKEYDKLCKRPHFKNGADTKEGCRTEAHIK